MEQKPKKREWVKNAAIIFLAVMLVLTFFSNTILNRTLPEVVTRYVEPNSIDAKVRISGTVSARENYDVMISQTQKVASVAVRVGQEIHTGDLLFTLEPGDSDELEAAKKELEQLKINYERAQLSATVADYAKEDRDIELARAAVIKAIETRDGLAVDPAALTAAEKAVADAEEAVASAKALVRKYTSELTDAQFGFSHSSDGSGVVGSGGSSGMYDAIKNAEAALAAAENALRAARLAYGVFDTVTPGPYYQLKQNALNRIIAAKPPSPALTAVETGHILAALDQELPSDAKITPTARETTYIQMMPYYMELVASDYAITPDTQLTAYRSVSEAKANYSAAAEALNAARSSYNDANSGIGYDYGSNYEGKTHEWWEKEVIRIEKLQLDAQERQTDAETALEQARTLLQKQKDQKTAWENAVNDVEEKQRTLDNLLFALSEQKKTDGQNQKLEALGLREISMEMADVQKKIDSLSGSAVTEVRAKVNGTVASLSVSAGHKAEAEKALASIEVQDLGYTLTATVTADQARLLHVGDTAAVSNYYWGSQTTAVLSGIQPDPKNPRTGRVLTFDIAGDISSGDKISFSIGEKNASYDLVVPNSAVRSDTNGSFVLMITAKNSPLGNRYFATRVDVEVIAADDFNTAVKGALSNMDSVITTSSGNAPVKNGDQVRLADTN